MYDTGVRHVSSLMIFDCYKKRVGKELVTYGVKELAPVVIALDDNLDGDIWAVLFEELSQHLALWEERHGGLTGNDVSYHFVCC